MLYLFVNISGLILIILIIWWFILKKPKSINIYDNNIQILVKDGVYDPPVITAKKGKEITLNFLRKDESPCSSIVRFDKLDISESLPINKVHKIRLNIKDAGEYSFTCQMGMYRGKVIIN